MQRKYLLNIIQILGVFYKHYILGGYDLLLFGVLFSLVLDIKLLAVNSEFIKVIKETFAVDAVVVRRFIASGLLLWFGDEW